MKQEASCFFTWTENLDSAKHFDKTEFPKNRMDEIIEKYQKLYPKHAFKLYTIVIKTEYRLVDYVAEN